MNPTEVFDALDGIASVAFDPAEFPLAFAEATDNARATVARLRTGTLNRSDLPGGVLLNRKFHFAPAAPGAIVEVLAALRASRKTERYRPAILIATDGIDVAAEHATSGEIRHFPFAELGDHFGFLMPAAGKERYQPAEESPMDVKATGKVARLYDAILEATPDWGLPHRRHDMNRFMTRLIFCFFAEHVGIFPDKRFSAAVFTYGGDRGEFARVTIENAFSAMNLAPDDRYTLPAWARALPYVNGGLFAGPIEAPGFDTIAFRYLREVSNLGWREINPDIFGSMIQSIADPDARSELGMHYTSVPNIMRVLAPLFLDDIDAEIEKAWDRPKALGKVLDRLARIRVFDPACGSGNFLVIAYRELRAREIRILTRIQDLKDGNQARIWSDAELSAGLGMGNVISLSSFYGIELSDFAAETAKLALFIAEQQANRRFGEATGRMPKSLPLKGGGSIFCGNALRIEWEAACPPLSRDDEEVFIVGNPPYYGAKKRTADQNEDMEISGLGDAQILDYVCCWIEKVSRLRLPRVEAALVATSSVCQGEQVARLWPRVLGRGLALRFAYRPFRWRNSAADVAGVTVTVIGLSRTPPPQRRLFDEEIVTVAGAISPYLVTGSFVPVAARSTPIGDLPAMDMGSNPVDGKRLILTIEEGEAIVAGRPDAARFIRRYLGGDELIYDTPRACLWIEDDGLEAAMAIPEIAERVEACRLYRQTAGRDARRAAARPHRFCYSTWLDRPALMVPNTQSEDRRFIPAAPIPAGVVVNHNGFAIYDAPGYVLALIGSSLHRAWLATVGGRMDNRFRYAVRLVYNTFPTPSFTEAQKDALARSAREILRVRYEHDPMTLAELYDSGSMPADLARAHAANDELVESMYVGRAFRNDTERLEHLFKVYAARVRALEAA